MILKGPTAFENERFSNVPLSISYPIEQQCALSDSLCLNTEARILNPSKTRYDSKNFRWSQEAFLLTVARRDYCAQVEFRMKRRRDRLIGALAVKTVPSLAPRTVRACVKDLVVACVGRMAIGKYRPLCAGSIHRTNCE